MKRKWILLYICSSSKRIWSSPLIYLLHCAICRDVELGQTRWRKAKTWHYILAKDIHLANKNGQSTQKLVNRKNRPITFYGRYSEIFKENVWSKWNGNMSRMKILKENIKVLTLIGNQRLRHYPKHLKLCYEQNRNVTKYIFFPSIKTFGSTHNFFHNIWT